MRRLTLLFALFFLLPAPAGAQKMLIGSFTNIDVNQVNAGKVPTGLFTLFDLSAKYDPDDEVHRVGDPPINLALYLPV